MSDKNKDIYNKLSNINKFNVDELKNIKKDMMDFSLEDLLLIRADAIAMSNKHSDFSPLAFIIGLSLGFVVPILSEIIKNVFNIPNKITPLIILIMVCFLLMPYITKRIPNYLSSKGNYALVKEIADLCIEEKMI